MNDVSKMDFRLLMREGPRTIGMMSVVLESGGSLDTAVREVAESGPDSTSKLFSRIVQDADVRISPDIISGLNSLLSSFPKELASFRRSTHMLIAASEMSPGPEKTRVLKDATDISLNGLKEMGESFSSSLTNPCMIIFGLGIMVPMILMSILPILQIGGMFGESVGLEPIIIVTLVAVPACVFCITLTIKNKNPFGANKGDGKWSSILPLFVFIPFGALGWYLTGDIIETVMFATVPTGSIAFVYVYPSRKTENKRIAAERMLKDSVFELGNRLISGENFENSAIGALETRKETSYLAEQLKKEMILCRGDVISAISTTLNKISPIVANSYCEVYEASLKDIRDAGRMAISIGRQMQDQENVIKNISNKLKSMLDMMTTTAAVFAPMVLGLCVAMLAPLTTISEVVDMTSISVIIAAYLIELCVLMAILTTALTGNNGISNVTYRFSMMLPISMVIFFMCMSFAL